MTVFDEEELRFMLKVLSQYMPKGPVDTQFTLILHDKIARMLEHDDGRRTT